MEVRVLTYNIYQPVDKPIRFAGQNERMQRLENVLKGLIDTHAPDVLVLQEVLNRVSRLSIQPIMQRLGYPYCSDKVQARVTLSGGILIYSKWPIVTNSYTRFGDMCRGSDCMATKGVTYACLDKQGHLIHVLGTHLQAGLTDEAHSVRREQMTHLKTFVDGLNIPASEPVLLAGDLNIDLYTHRTQLEQVFQRVKAAIPNLVPGTARFSSDPEVNKLVGSDDIQDYHSAAYPHGCIQEYYDTWQCVCCVPMMLDYAVPLTDYLAPDSHSMQVLPVTTPDTFEIALTMHRKVDIVNVSDHYPVLGIVQYPAYTSRTTAELQAQELSNTTVDSSSTTDSLLIAAIVLISITLFLLISMFLVKMWHHDYQVNSRRTAARFRGYNTRKSKRVSKPRSRLKA